MSKKDLIKRWKNGEEFSRKRGCWSVGKRLKRYLTKKTCKLNNQQRREVVEEITILYEPDYAIHPGESVKDLMNYNGLDKHTLAKKMCCRVLA